MNGEGCEFAHVAPKPVSVAFSLLAAEGSVVNLWILEIGSGHDMCPPGQVGRSFQRDAPNIRITIASGITRPRAKIIVALDASKVEAE